MKQKQIIKILLFLASSLLILNACHNEDKHHSHDHSSLRAVRRGNPVESEITSLSATPRNDDEEHHDGEIVIPEDRAKELGIQTITIEAKDFISSIYTSGMIDYTPDSKIVITAKSSGIIYFEPSKALEGTYLNKNEIIAFINTEGLIEGNSLSKALNNYNRIAEEYQRAKELRKDQIISQKEFLLIENEYKNSQNAVKDLETRGLAIKSPNNCQIIQILVQNGQYVNEGETIAILYNSQKAILKANLQSKHFNAKINDARFKTSYSDNIYSINDLDGKLLSKATNLQNGAYISLYFEFDNRSSALPIDSFVEVWLSTSVKKNTIAIPLTSLIEEQGNFFVFVKNDKDCYIKQRVILGEKNDSETEVLSGLSIGTNVVSQGVFQVKLSKAAVIPGHSHNH